MNKKTFVNNELLTKNVTCLARHNFSDLVRTVRTNLIFLYTFESKV